jgi:hypothetical protein
MLVVAVLIFVVSPAADAAQVHDRPTKGVFGIKLGLISRANIRGDLELETEIGSSAQVYADFPIFKDLFLTASVDFYYIQIIRQNDIMIEGTGGLKHEFALNRAGMFLRPGVGVGYAYLPEIGVMESTDYITLKVLVEAHFPIDKKKAWVGELAVMGAPKGGNDDVELSFGPGFIVRWGLAFR